MLPEIDKEAVGMKKLRPLYKSSVSRQDIYAPVAWPDRVARKYQVDMTHGRIGIDRQLPKPILPHGHFFYRRKGNTA